MHGTFACLDMESLMLAAQVMTPTSSWALAQIFLLGHEVPWTAVRRSEFGRYSIPMGKHQMTSIWFAPHTRHPPWVSHPHRKHSQEGAPRMKGQQHTQELRIPPVALEAISIQGSCNPQHSFSKPAGKAIMKAKSINRTSPLIRCSKIKKQLLFMHDKSNRRIILFQYNKLNTGQAYMTQNLIENWPGHSQGAVQSSHWCSCIQQQNVVDGCQHEQHHQLRHTWNNLVSTFGM